MKQGLNGQKLSITQLNPDSQCPNRTGACNEGVPQDKELQGHRRQGSTKKTLVYEKPSTPLGVGAEGVSLRLACSEPLTIQFVNKLPVSSLLQPVPPPSLLFYQ